MGKLLNDALKFAIDCHACQMRKGGKLPYIVHPAEVVGIISSLTTDEEVMAAGALHDVVEDCGVTLEEIEKRFGKNVRDYVMYTTEKRTGEASPENWKERKIAAIEEYAASPYEGKIVAIADKLSNLRSMLKDKREMGNSFWSKFNQKDPSQQKWYYGETIKIFECFKGTVAYDEITWVFSQIFD